LRATDEGTIATYEVHVDPGGASLLGRAGSRVQKVAGTVNPGESKSYKSTKAPATTTTTAAPTTAAAPSTAATTATEETEEDPVPEPPDCSEYPEGSMMRVLCEHDPFSA